MQDIDNFGRAIGPANPRSGKTIYLRKRMAHDHIVSLARQNPTGFIILRLDVFLVSAIQNQKHIVRQGRMQPAHLGPRQIGSGGVFRIGQIDDARSGRQRGDHPVDRGHKAIIRHRDHFGIVGIGIVRHLEISVGAADQIVAGFKIGPRRPRQKIVGAMADDNA